MDWSEIKKTVKIIAEEIREQQVIKSEVICNDIFNILEQNCTVLYYPLEEETNKGFHVKRVVNNELKDFVYINTSKPLNEQIFTAAHEFGHIYRVSTKVWEKLNYEKKELTEEIDEKITNLFAAELLMPEKTFRNLVKVHLKEMDIKADKVTIEELVNIMVFMMNDFDVPFKAIRKRLVETQILNENDGYKLKELEEKGKLDVLIESFSKDQNTYYNKPTQNKTISRIRSLVEELEKQEVKDECLLNKIKSDFDINTDSAPISNVDFEISTESDSLDSGRS